MPEYGWIYDSRQVSEDVRVVNRSHSIHNASSFNKLMNTYWGDRRIQSPAKDLMIECFAKITSFFIFFQITPSEIFEKAPSMCRVLNILRFWIFQDCQYMGFSISRVTRDLPIFVNMSGCWISVWMQLWKGFEYYRIPNIPGFCICEG